jgi:hypothetical protein
MNLPTICGTSGEVMKIGVAVARLDRQRDFDSCVLNQPGSLTPPPKSGKNSATCFCRDSRCPRANFDTASYPEFANGSWLTRPAMVRFWDGYALKVGDRKKITASPLQATTQQLAGLPPA